jgi:hypothetical protein
MATRASALGAGARKDVVMVHCKIRRCARAGLPAVLRQPLLEIPESPA